MKFELTRGSDPGARPEDIAQEAIDATATTYAHDQSIDVTEHLRVQLSSRGLRALRDEDLASLAERIRSGPSVRFGEHDGSIDSSTAPDADPTPGA